MTRLIGYVRRVSPPQSTDRQEADLLAAGVLRDDVYVDQGVPGPAGILPQLTRALDSLRAGDSLVITTLDRLGQSTRTLPDFVQHLRERGASLRVLHLGGAELDTSTPTGSTLFTIIAALAKSEHDIKREQVINSISNRRATGKDLGGRPRQIADSQIRRAKRLVASGTPTEEAARELGMSRATFYRRSRDLTD